MLFLEMHTHTLYIHCGTTVVLYTTPGLHSAFVRLFSPQDWEQYVLSNRFPNFFFFFSLSVKGLSVAAVSLNTLLGLG